MYILTHTDTHMNTRECVKRNAHAKIVLCGEMRTVKFLMPCLSFEFKWVTKLTHDSNIPFSRSFFPSLSLWLALFLSVSFLNAYNRDSDEVQKPKGFFYKFKRIC